MKLKTLAVAAGVGATLILAGPSDAGFLGIYVVKKPNAFDLMTVNVYAEFDNPGHDWMRAVRGTLNAPMNIVVIGGGEFYNHPFGDDRPPVAAAVEAFPSLGYDSFYTIGVKALMPGHTDALTIFNMPLLEGTGIHVTSGSWSLLPSTAAQGNPFDPVNSFPGNGSILIGQFSVPLAAMPNGIAGEFLLEYVSDGAFGQSYVGFNNGAECASDVQCDDGDPCNGMEWCGAEYECHPGIPDPDCNGNGVLDACDIAAGTSTDANGNGVPDDCDVLCPGDIDGDGTVGAADFLDLMWDWGPCVLPGGEP